MARGARCARRCARSRRNGGGVVNEFVAECRREWKRLGVPDPVADEMAADLAADLDEAEAEGASAETVLGSGAFDPRSFAAEWAAARGVIDRPPPAREGLLRRARVPAATAVCALIAIVGAVLVVRDSRSAPERFAVAPDGMPTLRAPLPARIEVTPPDVLRVWVAPTVPGNSRASSARAIGSVLLIVGLAGVLFLATLSVLTGPGRSPALGSRRYVGPAR